jgi:hypothetical protein
MEENELFGEAHEQEENGLFGRRHQAEQLNLCGVVKCKIMELVKDDKKEQTKVFTFKKGCNCTIVVGTIKKPIKGKFIKTKVM